MTTKALVLTGLQTWQALVCCRECHNEIHFSDWRKHMVNTHRWASYDLLGDDLMTGST